MWLEFDLECCPLIIDRYEPANIYSLLLAAGYLKVLEKGCRQMDPICARFAFQIKKLRRSIKWSIVAFIADWSYHKSNCK